MPQWSKRQEKTKMITARVPESMAERIDALAQKNDVWRTTLVIELLDEALRIREGGRGSASTVFG